MHRLTEPYLGLPAQSGAGVPSDAELIAGVRAGAGEPYDVLVDRHRHAARYVATALAGPTAGDHVADRVVDLATQAVLVAMLAGGGPEVAFRPYFLAAVVGSHHAGPTTLFVAPHDPAQIWRDGSATGTAMAGLPEQSQLLRWHLDVEGEHPLQVAPLLGVPTPEIEDLLDQARVTNVGDRLEVGAVILGDAAVGCFRDRTAYEMPPARRSFVSIARVPAIRTAAAVSAVALIAAGAVTASLGGATAEPAGTAVRGPSIAIIPAPTGAATRAPSLDGDGPPSTTDTTPSSEASGSAAASPGPSTKKSPRPGGGFDAIVPGSPSSPAPPEPSAPSGSSASASADIGIAARSSAGTVSWSVSGLPAGASTLLTIAADEGMTLTPAGDDCTADTPRMLTCTVTAGEPEGSFGVDDLTPGTGQVSLSVQPVAGLDDPASGNNEATVSP